MRAALYWAKFLHAAGVQRVFGHPGTESIELIEAANEVGLDFVLTHHEATAGFAASMTGRLTRVPGVCVITAGPGATNIASAVAQAHLDRMPLLVFTGDHSMGPGQPRHQRLPPDLFAPIARATIRLAASTLREDLPRALDIASRHPQGPVYVTFPSDEMLLDVGDDAPLVARRPSTPAALTGDLARARVMIESAARPLLIAGLGVTAAGAEEQFRQLASALGAPVADTPQGRGSFPTDDPRYVGTFATHRDAGVAAVADASDLVIAVGLDSAEFLKPWQLSGPVLSLTSSGVGADPAIPVEHAVSGPLDTLLAELSRAAKPAGQWNADQLAQLSGRGADPRGRTPVGAPDSAMWPQAVVDALQDLLPADAIVSVDVGSHKLLMVQRWVVHVPGTFLNSSGMSSMGTGIPFALAASLARPGRQVVAVVGDGGLLMYAGELATLARLSARLVVVVMADSALYSIKIKQLRRSYRPIGTEFPGVRVADVARSFGLSAERAETANALRVALRQALDAGGPAVIEAVVDPAGYELSQ